MNTSPVHIIGLGVLLAGSLLAQSPASPPAWQPLKIQQTVAPVFPPHLLNIGLNTGVAKVVIDTDADGKLSEWLVLGYTNEDFGDAAVQAIQRWTYEPAQLDGRPVGSIVELNFDFSVSGIVVSTPNIVEQEEAHVLRVRPGRFTYLACAARDLDRTPTPVVTLAPRYPASLAKRGLKGTVRIEFYIDKTGAVRLPSVAVEEDSELAALAIEAVRQWKFAPPTSHGRPVLVQASEDFHFGG
jgi:TonB family protein